jgi:peptide/nickel transport system permease protein
MIRRPAASADTPLAALAGPTAEPPAVERRPGRHPVLGFLVRRVAAGVATLIAVSILVFAATNVLPGNVADAVLGRNSTPELVQRLTDRLNLDSPLLSRYLTWLGGFARGDMGDSAVAVAQNTPNASVADHIGVPLRNSLVLAVGTIVLLIPLSLLLGTLAAVHAGRPTDYGISYTSLLTGALPEFVLGTFLILILFSQLDLLPPVALVRPGESPLDNVRSLVLPILTLLGVSLAFSTRQVRVGVLEALRQDYVKFARLNGVSERRVRRRYALRNALAPSIQTFAQTVQYLFGGIIVVEALFAYPGIGSLFVQAVNLRDVTEVQAIAVVLAAIYIVINIVADLLVLLVVPKLRAGQT